MPLHTSAEWLLSHGSPYPPRCQGSWRTPHGCSRHRATADRAHPAPNDTDARPAKAFSLSFRSSSGWLRRIASTSSLYVMSLPFAGSASLSSLLLRHSVQTTIQGSFMRTERACRRKTRHVSADNFQFSSVVPSGEAYPLIEIPCRNAQLSARSNPMASVIRRRFPALAEYSVSTTADAARKRIPDAAFMQGAAACLTQERIVIRMFRHRPAHPRSELTNRRTIGQSHRKSAGGSDAFHCLYPAATSRSMSAAGSSHSPSTGHSATYRYTEGVSIAGGPPMIDVTVRKAGQ